MNHKNQNIFLAGLITFIIFGCKKSDPDIGNGTSLEEKPYQPTIESIIHHKIPEWFKDAKFGMFVDWGLYSVPGWAPKLPDSEMMYPDWYLYRMYTDLANPERLELHERFRSYHEANWGADFERDDFLPLFTAAKYDPEKLADIAVEAGMKYIVPFSKHHDGFCLWPSSYTKRTAKDLTPAGKDLIKPLVEAARERSLKTGFYFSLEEWEYPIIRNNGDTVLRWFERPKITYLPYDEAKYAKRITGKKPVKDFYGDYILPQAKEYIDLYDPDILWFDGDWNTPIEETRSPEIIAWFYNKAQGRKEVAVNDRLGMNTRNKLGDFFTAESQDIGNGVNIGLKKWERCRGISQSYGYNRDDTDENVMQSKEVVHMLIDIVSRGGNLLLITNLDGEGALPEIQLKRLREVGKWLAINGEAIYSTRPYIYSRDDNDSVHYTQSKDGRTIYAICLEWPGSLLELQNIFLPENAKTTLLGTGREMEWNYKYSEMQTRLSHLEIQIPDRIEKPCDYAWVFRIQQ